MRFARDGHKIKLQQPVSNQPAWNGWLGVIFVILMFFVSQIIGGFLLAAYFGATGLSESEIVRLTTESVYVQFSFVLLTEIIILGSLYLFLKRYRASIRDIGLKRPRAADVGKGLLMVVPYYLMFLLVVVVASALIPGLDTDQKQEIGFENVQGFIPLALTFLILVVLQPITEEIVIRGFLYDSLKKVLPFVLAVIGTSLIFAAAHLPAGGAAGPLYIAGIDTFILSLFLIYLREKTGSLWSCITLHSVKNGIAFLALFIFKVG